MKAITVLFGTVLLLAVAMSAAAGGIRGQIDPELTAEVEALLEDSPLREYAGLERTPIPPAPVLIDNAAPGVPAGVPEAAPYRGAPFVELAFIEDGYLPLTDLDALYGVHGPPVVQVQPAPAFDAAPADLVDDTPAMVAWANPPLDAK